MPVRAVILDIGGVLEVNPRTGWPARWGGRLGLEADAFEAQLDAIWGPGATGAATLEEIERLTAEAFGLSDAALAELMDDAWSEYVGTLNEALADWFAGLRPRYRTGILSNSFVGAREREQELYGFAEMCNTIVYSHEVGWLKPDPRIYHAVCGELGVTPQDAVFLDDLPANVEGARAVGMRAVTYVDTDEAIAELNVQLAGR
ncbi:MAG: HAD family hydrolase [Solirubrobacteraceae bacterium]